MWAFRFDGLNSTWWIFLHLQEWSRPFRNIYINRMERFCYFALYLVIFTEKASKELASKMKNIENESEKNIVLGALRQFVYCVWKQNFRTCNKNLLFRNGCFKLDGIGNETTQFIFFIPESICSYDLGTFRSFFWLHETKKWADITCAQFFYI